MVTCLKSKQKKWYILSRIEKHFVMRFAGYQRSVGKHLTVIQVEFPYAD